MSVENASTLMVTWVKSSYSDTGAQCVELAVVDADRGAVRDSKNPSGPALLFPRESLRMFVAAAASGEFGDVRHPGAP
ncbi:hypothetical protein SRB5_58470 [Streptomyces sp. RB5]|uniref:DUF397 domain-containing protein n=1 Tax=Streptomyces smaragdinus TaxID=2585196 RepID=A0A7K0CQC0_9ACTN|nr:DUF397 domain-containing protein [Streptomyces smaragdinus]MQY15659.1 hypothetical protein [Streptomyces smaragdinus]